MWKVEYTKRFLKELSRLPDNIQDRAVRPKLFEGRYAYEGSRLPDNIQDRAESIVFKELKSENPFGLGYLEKMKGYADKYKIRIGNYRIGLSINSAELLVKE